MDAACSSGSTPLYIASQKGYSEVRIVLLIIHYAFNPRNINHRFNGALEEKLQICVGSDLFRVLISFPN